MIKLTTNEVDTMRQAYEKMPAEVMVEMSYALNRVGQRVVATMRTLPWQGGDQGLRVRSGALRRGFVSHVTATGTSELNLTVSNDVKYGPIQEYGGTVTPKKGKYLAIPIGAAKTGAGVPRFPGGPRTVPNLVFIQRAGRNPLLMQRTGKGQLQPMFVLVESVYIPPRLRFGFYLNRLVYQPGDAMKTEMKAAIRRLKEALGQHT